MSDAVPPKKLHLDQLIRDMAARFDAHGPQDFLPLLEQMAADYGTSSEYLLSRGFRKAYRQLIEGV